MEREDLTLWKRWTKSSSFQSLVRTRKWRSRFPWSHERYRDDVTGRFPLNRHPSGEAFLIVMRMYVYKATSWISLSIWIEIVVGAGLVDHSDCFPLCVLRSTHGHSLQFASECLRSLCFSAILSALLVRPLLLNYPTLDTRMPFSTIHLLLTRPRFFPLWKIFNTRTSRAKWQPLTASLPSHVYQPTKQLLRPRFYEFLGNWSIADHGDYSTGYYTASFTNSKPKQPTKLFKWKIYRNRVGGSNFWPAFVTLLVKL